LMTMTTLVKDREERRATTMTIPAREIEARRLTTMATLVKEREKRRATMMTIPAREREERRGDDDDDSGKGNGGEDLITDHNSLTTAL
jgi:hypothetical protein